jgi:hypothetical protein
MAFIKQERVDDDDGPGSPPFPDDDNWFSDREESGDEAGGDDRQLPEFGGRTWNLPHGNPSKRALPGLDSEPVRPNAKASARPPAGASREPHIQSDFVKEGEEPPRRSAVRTAAGGTAAGGTAAGGNSDGDPVVKEEPAKETPTQTVEEQKAVEYPADNQSDWHPANFCNYVQNDDEAKCRELLEEKPALCNLRSRKDNKSKTPLCVAAWYGLAGMVMMLLEFGAETNDRARRSNKDSTELSVADFAAESAQFDNNTQLAAKIMLILELHRDGVDSDILREIAFEGMIPVEYHDRLEELEAESKRAVAARKAEEARKEREKAEKERRDAAMGVKWEQDSHGRWSQTGGEDAGLAREVAALRHEVAALRESRGGGHRPRERSPRGDHHRGDPRGHEGGYYQQGYHGGYAGHQRAAAPAPVGRYVRQTYQVKADPYGSSYGYGDPRRGY